MTTFIQPLTPESVTVSTVAIGITARPGGSGLLAHAAVIEVESNPIRYWETTSPTASVGILVQAGGTIELTGRTAINNFRAIRQGSSDATLRVQPYAEFHG